MTSAYEIYDEDFVAAAESRSADISCCDSEEQSCFHSGSCTEPDLVSQESFSFSLHDTSSLSDELGEMVTTIDGPTIFDDFALCFHELERMQHVPALLQDSPRILSTTRTLSVKPPPPSSASPSQTISLTQFLWRPEVGLCGYALQHNYEDTITHKNSEELILFQEEEVHDSNDYHEPLLRPGSRLSTSTNCTEGGTLEDPRYVPRPSSTTHGLREMSKFFRNLSIAEDKKHIPELLAKEPVSLQNPEITAYPASTTEKGEMAAALDSTKITNALKTTPTLGRFLQRRSRSELSSKVGGCSNVSLPSPPASISGVSGTVLQRSRTEDTRYHRRSSSEDTSAKRGGGGKSSSLVSNFLRRTPRLPSFLKTQLSQKSLFDNKDKLHKTSASKNQTTDDDLDCSADIANILASLEDSLKEKVANKKSVAAVKPSEPLSTQGSGETSDTSSLFGGMESDSEEEDSYYSDDDSCSSEDDAESADRFFATPYYASGQKWTTSSSTTARSRRLSTHSQSRDDRSDRDSWDTPSMISSRTELTRCSSVDTAKASNLSCDPGADRARLLEIQAYLWQQQQERERLLNAPPVEFFHNDNVIRVREAACETIDAACEIEVLPKEACSTSSREDETVCFPPTAAEF